MTQPEIPPDPHDVDPAAAREAARRRQAGGQVEFVRLPDAVTQAAGTTDPEGDRARARLRDLEREVRRQKRIARTALTDAARRQAQTRVRDVQAAIRRHVEATGIPRDLAREQLHWSPPDQ